VFQFRIGRIPVEVHFSHVLISGVIALTFAQGGGSSNDWPATILRDPSHPQRPLTLALVVALWMGIISLSVLVHELGHATAARFFGYPARIQLIGLGGLTHAQGAETMPWYKDVLYTLAGPSAGLSLGILAGLTSLIWVQVTPPPQVVRYLLTSLLYANVVWTVLNLLPMATLDGGRISAAVLTRLMGRRGFLVAQAFSVLLVGAVLLFAVFNKDPMLGALMVMLGLRTFANIAAYNRGELPVGDGAHPLLVVMQQAEATYRQGNLDGAKQATLAVLQQEPPPVVKSRAHFLLGWVALKAGQGRAALDHFAQVQGIAIPPHAAAAAFTLLGDEARALPLWAEAVRAAPEDPVILHEFAGALMRADREVDARRLPGVRPALAYAAAERVLYVRGDYARAAQMAEAAFREEPSATVAYDAACAWARANDATAALRMLTLASQNGFADAKVAREDPDLASLQQHAGFLAWLDALPAA
jgi:Zn-dependent protease